MYCKNCDAPNADSAKVCCQCGAALPHSKVTAYHPGENRCVPTHPMKWYYFVIYVQLFLVAAGQFISVILLLLGIPNCSVPSQWIYLSIAAVLRLGVSILALVVRFQLSAYKSRGPKLLYLLWGALVLLPLLELLMAAVLYPAVNASFTFSSIAAVLVMLVCNIVYFEKRKDCFIY